MQILSLLHFLFLVFDYFGPPLDMLYRIYSTRSESFAKNGSLIPRKIPYCKIFPLEIESTCQNVFFLTLIFE